MKYMVIGIALAGMLAIGCGEPTPEEVIADATRIAEERILENQAATAVALLTATPVPTPTPTPTPEAVRVCLWEGSKRHVLDLPTSGQAKDIGRFEDVYVAIAYCGE